MITKYFKYPWGERLVYYDSFIVKKVNETTNETLLEKSFYNCLEMIEAGILFNILKIRTNENEIGFKQYNDDCFEYTISVKKGEDIEEQKILVYRMGFLNEKQNENR